MTRAYGADLAYIHDVGFSGLVSGWAPALLGILRQHGVRSGRVVDLGCGSGVWARELCEHGYEVVGVDISPAMIRLARERAPGARFVCGSFLSAELPACDAVTALGEVLSYRFDSKSGRRALERFFRRVYGALGAGGVFVFDVAEPGRGGPDGIRQGFSAGKDWAVLFRAEENPTRRSLTRHIITFRKHGRSYRRGEETHRIRLYPRAEIVGMLERAGFTARVVRFGGGSFAPGQVGFVAQKSR